MSTEVDPRANWSLELATPELLKDLGILVHIFTSTYEITTSYHATRPMLSLSLDIISYTEVRPCGNDNIVPVPANFISASSTDKGEHLFHPLPEQLRPLRVAIGPVPGPCSRARRYR